MTLIQRKQEFLDILQSYNITLIKNNIVATLIKDLITTIHHFDTDKQYKIVFMIHKFLFEHSDNKLSIVLNQLLLIVDPSKIKQKKYTLGSSFPINDKNNAIRLSNTSLEYICNYFDKLLKIRSSENVYKRSFFGATACTFLPLDADFPWVLKWQGRFEAEAEYVCTEFLRKSFCHLSIPIILFDLENVTQRLSRYKIQMKLEGVVLSKHIPILVEYKEGSNLKFMCKNFLESDGFISPEEISKICILFGEIAGYDFLIGNTDRLIPNDIHNHSIKTYHKANGGNLQIELNLAFTPDKNNSFRLLKCHLIDNAPCFGSFFSLTEKKQESPKDTEEDIYNLYSEEGNGSNENAGLNNYNYKGEIPEEENYEKREEPEEDAEGKKLREKMLNSFIYFFNSSTKELNFIASIIAQGLINECKFVLTNQSANNENKNDEIEYLYKKYDKLIIEGIELGLEKAKKNIKNPDLLTIIEGIKQENNYIKTTKIYLNFIETNLKIAQKKGTFSIITNLVTSNN